MADPGYLRFARELEARDAAIAESLATVRALQADGEELRTHAEVAVATIEGYPKAAAAVQRALAEAGAERDARERDLAAAEAELERAKQGEAQAAARRSLTRAADAANSARKRVSRGEAEREALEREQDHALTEISRARARARKLAERLAAFPRATAVAASENVVDWAARARAALFVAAGGLETERERVVREANELAAAALGDPTVAMSATLVRAHLERSAESGTIPASPS